jgi:hypothetical protein
LASGQHLVEIKQLTTGTEVELSSKNILQLYPNPAQTELNIVLPTHAVTNSIEIYNSLGVKVQNYTNTQKVDISNLSVGIYFIKVRLNATYYTASFLKD